MRGFRTGTYVGKEVMTVPEALYDAVGAQQFKAVRYDKTNTGGDLGAGEPLAQSTYLYSNASSSSTRMMWKGCVQSDGQHSVRMSMRHKNK